MTQWLLEEAAYIALDLDAARAHRQADTDQATHSRLREMAARQIKGG